MTSNTDLNKKIKKLPNRAIVLMVVFSIVVWGFVFAGVTYYTEPAIDTVVEGHFLLKKIVAEIVE